MALLLCLACKRNDFKSRSGLGLHRNKCKLVVPVATAMLERRDQRLRRKDQEKRKRKEERQVDGNKMEVKKYNKDELVSCDILMSISFLTWVLRWVSHAKPSLTKGEPMFQPLPTISGRIHRIPHQYKNFLSPCATSVPHMRHA
jgi:hypothetical protein